MTKKNFYPEVQANTDFSDLEKKILAYWQENNIFQKSIENRPQIKNGQNNEFIFYDGPPFANGLPHYGHLLTGFIKDAYARYKFPVQNLNAFWVVCKIVKYWLI